MKKTEIEKFLEIIKYKDEFSNAQFIANEINKYIENNRKIVITTQNNLDSFFGLVILKYGLFRKSKNCVLYSCSVHDYAFTEFSKSYVDNLIEEKIDSVLLVNNQCFNREVINYATRHSIKVYSIFNSYVTKNDIGNNLLGPGTIRRSTYYPVSVYCLLVYYYLFNDLPDALFAFCYLSLISEPFEQNEINKFITEYGYKVIKKNKYQSIFTFLQSNEICNFYTLKTQVVSKLKCYLARKNKLDLLALVDVFVKNRKKQAIKLNNIAIKANQDANTIFRKNNSYLKCSFKSKSKIVQIYFDVGLMEYIVPIMFHVNSSINFVHGNINRKACRGILIGNNNYDFYEFVSENFKFFDSVQFYSHNYVKFDFDPAYLEIIKRKFGEYVSTLPMTKINYKKTEINLEDITDEFIKKYTEKPYFDFLNPYPGFVIRSFNLSNFSVTKSGYYYKYEFNKKTHILILDLDLIGKLNPDAVADIYGFIFIGYYNNALYNNFRVYDIVNKG